MWSSIKEQTKRLWKASFDDTDNFVELYFDRVFHTDINHTIEYEGRVVAALQAIPFLFKTGDKILKTAYLSGIPPMPTIVGRDLWGDSSTIHTVN